MARKAPRKTVGMGEGKKQISIGWIVAAFIFPTPLGSVLLGLRYRQNKAEQLKGGRSLFKVALWFIGLFFLLMLIDFTGIEDFFYSFYFFGAGGFFLFFLSLFMIRQGLRDEKYSSAVEKHALTRLDDISAAVGYPVSIVTRDLQRMIRDGIYPEAVLSQSKMTFFLSPDDAKPEVLKTLRCAGCGATVVAVSGKDTICEYCGAPVNYV